MNAVLVAAIAMAAAVAMELGARAGEPGGGRALDSGEFRWTAKGPLVSAANSAGGPWHAIKDPSVVRHGGKWHLFCTVRGANRSHAIQYLAFPDWAETETAERVTLPMHEGFFCAPQVFYFTPHRKWYLICQASDERWKPPYRPAYSTNDDVGDPGGWSRLEPLCGGKPEEPRAWLDFWVICDQEKAHLFFTSLDGRMWRMEARRETFPKGWSKAAEALRGDVFEASHTYRLRGRDRYLALIEAQGGYGWRYYKAYTAPRLEGPWAPLAADKETAFASMRNVRQTGQHWTDVISHGELLRSGVDERLEVDGANLRFLFQGVRDRDRAGKQYGDIPWRLGILEPAGRE